MAAAKTAWGIDIGQCALKALKLRALPDGQMQVEAFEVIEHGNVLSQPEADTKALIYASLEEFLRRVDVSDSTVCVSVLGQSAFTRFVKLPPVEESKVPEIVRFEAEQQIPFPIDEVIWRYQTFPQPDSPELEVGIFAMKHIDVSEMLNYYQGVGIDVGVVQMAPLALYNFMNFDNQATEGGATLLADVGADKTHLVVADGSKIWTRTIQIGGNNFTEALVKSFKLSFAKAERLKRTAASSKYARQIFQVMRPIFADLVQEIQRSVGYYTSLNRDSRFRQLVGMGNGFRLPGMQKYLEQNLNMSVRRVGEFNRLAAPAGHFQEHTLSFGVAYGLAVQGLGESAVGTNLLPEAISRAHLWSQKKPLFATAAAAILLAAGVYTARAVADRGQLQADTNRRNFLDAGGKVETLKSWKRESRSIKSNVEEQQKQTEKFFTLRKYVTTIPALNASINRAVMATMLRPREIQDDLLNEFAAADAAEREELAAGDLSDQAILQMINMLPYEPNDNELLPTLRQKLIARLQSKPRQNRRILVVSEVRTEYAPDLRALLPEEPEEEDGGDSFSREEKPEARGFRLTLTARTPLTRDEWVRLTSEFSQTLRQSLDAQPELFELFDSLPIRTTQIEPERTGGGGRRSGWLGGGEEAEGATIVGPIDPLFPPPERESMAGDTKITWTLLIKINGDGLVLPWQQEEDEDTR